MGRRFPGKCLLPMAIACLVAACNPSREPAGGRVLDKITVVDFNLWHGLNPKGLLRFQEYEDRSGRETRLRGFIEDARGLDADILFLQEVNPAPGLTRRIADALGMDGVYQIDNAGVKIGPVGLPVNFRSGIAILARKSLGLRRLGSRKLSGPFGVCSTPLSLQFSEFRHALAAEVTLNGTRALLVNVHLHHGHEMTPAFREVVESRVREGAISRERANELEAIAASTSDRRMRELSGAMALAREHGIDAGPVIFAGDLNASPDSPEMKWLEEANGFKSVADDRHPEGLLPTWDTARNPNTRNQEDFSPANEFDAFMLENAKALWVGESRRLDYVLTRNIGGIMDLEEAGLFGDEPFQGRMISDHFGIFARFRLATPGSIAK